MVESGMQLGPRDDKRFASVEQPEREYLAFLIDYSLGILRTRPAQLEALHCAANALTALGYYQDGLNCDKQLLGLCGDDPLVVYNYACSLSLTGQLDEALIWLRKAITLGYRDGAHMKEDPDLAALRDNKRFAALLSVLAEGGFGIEDDNETDLDESDWI